MDCHHYGAPELPRKAKKGKGVFNPYKRRMSVCSCLIVLSSVAVVCSGTNIATRQWLNNTIGAVYLDGSTPAYYVKREADATRWVVWQKGNSQFW